MTIRTSTHTWDVQVLTPMGWVRAAHADLPTTRFFTLCAALDELAQPDDRCRILLDGHPLTRHTDPEILEIP